MKQWWKNIYGSNVGFTMTDHEALDSSVLFGTIVNWI